MKAIFTLGLGVMTTAMCFAVDSNSVLAFDNATVQAAGPRSGSSGKNFFNIEGMNNGSFASYGVIDVDGSMFNFGGPVGAVNNIRIDLTQSNAAFTTDGGVHFWLTTDTTTDIQPGTSPLVLDFTTTYGVMAGQLDTLMDLGGATFTQVGNGNVDSYSFAVSGAASTVLTDAVQSDTAMRLVITQEAGANDVAATWAGFSNTSFAGPTVTLSADPVPEPASMAVLGIGAFALLRRRKNK